METKLDTTHIKSFTVGVIFYIYHVFSTDNKDLKWAEADSFYCFMLLMSHLSDRFIPESDASQVGIIACINELDDILKLEDPLL